MSEAPEPAERVSPPEPESRRSDPVEVDPFDLMMDFLRVVAQNQPKLVSN